MDFSIIILLIAVIFLITAYSIYARFRIEPKLAINGYDLVAYFEINEPVKGKKEFNLIYDNKIYYFSSQKNKETFLKMPKYFLPQYDGFCSHGMSKGYKASTKPTAFTIVNDKLYLNYNFKYREDWLKDKEERIKRADYNWEKLHKN